MACSVIWRQSDSKRLLMSLAVGGAVEFEEFMLVLNPESLKFFSWLPSGESKVWQITRSEPHELLRRLINCCCALLNGIRLFSEWRWYGGAWVFWGPCAVSCWLNCWWCCCCINENWFNFSRLADLWKFERLDAWLLPKFGYDKLLLPPLWLWTLYGWML